MTMLTSSRILLVGAAVSIAFASGCGSDTASDVTTGATDATADATESTAIDVSDTTVAGTTATSAASTVRQR